MESPPVIEPVGRSPTGSEIADLARILVDVVESGGMGSAVAPLSLAAATEWWRGYFASLDPRAIVLVARERGAIVGTVSVLPAGELVPSKRAVIARLMVHRGVRDAGLGERLMTCAEEHARIDGFTSLALEAAGSTPPETPGFRKELRPAAEESLWSEYDAMEARLTSHVSERMLDLANLRRGARVLDLAAGRGEPAIRAAARVAPEGSVVGIDVSAPMLGMARARARSEGVANLELRVMDAESLAGFEDRSFDAILARWCAMYFSQPRRAFLEARRVIRPDGAFVVAVWAEPERVSYVSVPRDLLARRAALTPIDFAAPGTFRFARPGSLERELAEAGFVVRSVEERDTAVMEVGSGAELVRWCETFGMGRLLKDLPEATRRAWAEDLIAEGERRREGPWIRLGGVTRIVTACPR